MAAARGSVVDFRNCHENAAVLSHNSRGYTLGVIRLGNIGYEIARKAYIAFGMNSKYYDVIRKDAAKEAGIKAEFCSDLDAMLAVSDCVALAISASPDGKKVIAKEGSLVDEEAVADAVEQGRLVDVGMDVHGNEPTVNERLKASKLVTLTSHNAGGALKMHIGFESLVMRDIDAVLKGREPLTPVI
ncbi:2-hydroxyacid dehydrogenase [Diplocarpon rosae]|nr:2-hydroxyacid dehydrogenase [Diplocarpon rosae]